MAMNRIQLTSLRLLKSASTRPIPGGFLQQYGTEAACTHALRRARLLKGFVCPRCGGPLRSMREPAWRADMAVFGLSALDESAQRHDLRGHQAAVADVVSSALPADPEQDQRGGVRAHAALGRVLGYRLADSARPTEVPQGQADAGDDRA